MRLKFWDVLAYAVIFVAAVMLAVDTGIKQNVRLAAHMPDFLEGPLWGFTPLVLLLVGAGLVVWQHGPWARVKASASAPVPAETYLRLQFNHGNLLPQAVGLANIWRWYALYNDFAVIGPEGVQAHARSWSVFMMYDSPVIFQQFRIDGGGAALPRFEVKDSSQRHVVVWFGGELAGTTVDIRLVH